MRKKKLFSHHQFGVKDAQKGTDCERMTKKKR